MDSSKKKIAVVLFNLGGPDNLEAVEPFLHNLFSDPAIISAPGVIRKILARMISRKRTPIAQKIYAEIGNKSPILEETAKQAEALEKKLSENGRYRVFICMRYWHPMTEEVVRQVRTYAPEEIILLPLYPQFSSTTTKSSFESWEKEVKYQGLTIPTKRICCYPQEKHFISAHVRAIRAKYFEAAENGKPRILFSAHGLPEKVIKKGDPYQWQVEQTSAAVVAALGIPDLDYVVCYQSRVGPLKWIGPATEEEIKRAGKEKKALMVVPIAFVSEHSETLVELDMEYKKLAIESGVTAYFRIPALGIAEEYIMALAELCYNAPPAGETKPDIGKCLCPVKFSQCMCKG